MAPSQTSPEVSIRPLAKSDLDAADRVVRLAFGTFMGLPDPISFMGDAGYVHTRFLADPSAAIAAESDGQVIGSNFAANWGSFGFFGPLTVLPQYWDQHVGQKLVAATMEIFKRWGMRHMGLFTFAHSPKHMTLYQKFGFWPRDLVAVMSKDVSPEPRKQHEFIAHFSALDETRQSEALAACREITNANFEGLDVTPGIRSVSAQKLGETVVVSDGSRPVAFSVCHIGPGTEAGGGTCYIKFAAVLPGPKARENFSRLLDACESLAQQRRAQRLVAGVNLARREAFQEMYSQGFRTTFQGVAMETGDASSGYNRSGVYIVDDWR